MEMIPFYYRRIFFLKVAKFRYLLTKFLFKMIFLLAQDKMVVTYLFFAIPYQRLRYTYSYVHIPIVIPGMTIVMWLRHRLLNPKVESSISGDCTSELTSYNIFFFFFTSLTDY